MQPELECAVTLRQRRVPLYRDDLHVPDRGLELLGDQLLQFLSLLGRDNFERGIQRLFDGSFAAHVRKIVHGSSSHGFGPAISAIAERVGLFTTPRGIVSDSPQILNHPVSSDTAMSDNLDALILDLLEWLGPEPRPYIEVMDAWRTSCPRLPVWEETNERGYVDRRFVPDQGRFVSVSSDGMEFLRRHRTPANTSA